MKTNFWLQKRIHNLRCLILTKQIFDFFSHNLFAFFTLKNKPSMSRISGASRRSALRVKEKWARIQRKVHQGSRKSASAECVVVSWATSPNPWHTFLWPLTHFSLTPDALLLDLEGFFFRIKKAKSCGTKVKIVFWSGPNILKYEYAFVAKRQFFFTWESL